MGSRHDGAVPDEARLGERQLQALYGTASSGNALQIANGDQVGVSDCSNICLTQADERLSFAGCEHELDLKTIRRMQVDDGAQVTTTQAVLGKVPIQDDGVEQVEHG